MAFEITDLTELDPTLVQQQLQEAITRLQEAHPELDLKHGVFHDTVAYYHAQLEAAIRTNLNRYLYARSLRQIELDPTLADTDVVDDVLSNWRVTRGLGDFSNGLITVVLSDDTSVNIASGSIWVSNGKEFITELSYTAVPDPAQVANSSDRVMVEMADGNFAFTLPVKALEEGPDSNIRKDAQFLPSVQPQNFLTAYATDDFTQGESTETNDELLARLQQGIAAKTISNRINMRAMLREIEAFSRVINMSIVGYGDAEQLRDDHSIFPIHYGGRVDWYIRGQEQLFRVRLDKDAVLVAKTTETSPCYGTWQFGVAKNEAPGFYEIRSIRLFNAQNVAGGFEIVKDARGLDLTDPGFIPDIVTQEEGEYSRFQTTVIQFVDTVTDVTNMAVGSTQKYTAEAVTTPLVAEIQDTVSGRDVRSHGADALIKAPIPCFVQITFTVNKTSDEPNPDVDGIKNAIMDVVNSIGFLGRLDSSLICDAVHDYLRNATTIGQVDMLGRVRRPDGTTLWLRSYDVLLIKDDYARMVTSKTVQFYLDLEDISVNIETNIPTPV